MVFDLSTQLVASMSYVEGPLHAFWTLASESDFHNATTQLFTTKLITMAFAGAIQGKYSPDGGIQWHLG